MTSHPRLLAMIPARLGSQRLKQKNLREIAGASLVAWAVRKCRAAGVFDEIWVNSEAEEIGRIAEAEGARFHRRPPELANNVATSEQFVHEFLLAHPCDYLIQVHSIAPLLTTEEVRAFVEAMLADGCDVQLSCTLEQIECALDGRPVNFTFAEKTNSQELRPIQRVTWSITGWRRATYLEAFAAGRTATYAGRVAFHPLDRLAGHIIKTEEDLQQAAALWPLRFGARD
ncbi:MAG TPA: NTP transferase domain-containing protein [Candidatus Sumerlaeota bacterium]|nr:MAG: CMP-N,N'-diacetyllegionaminic acid synthase [candidate division BRC1 bacterium ADurb.BinA292]HOE95664.1 NTP transferase domain-containing protein [Candidatus Sumerlaeota bacterium]HOR27389.1 NTP transferase domain-containing protein [Candidatus Sumerlaeota bacterium]